jgi:type IV pilus assembly protein PilA
MIARIRKSMDENEGFTLIELLVVMIIIGILAAIAIPVFLNQRKKAVDTAAKADISTIGKEIATYYVDGTTALVAGDVATAAGRYTLVTGDIGAVSPSLGTPTLLFKPNGTTVSAQSSAWCVQSTYTGGTSTVVSYSALNGLQPGTACP